MRQTTIVKKEDIKKEWFLIDAKDQTLGKLSTLIASTLRGKTKKTFTPNVDMGDNVIVINAEKVRLSADKEDKKIYYSHSGYPGGLKTKTARVMRETKPASIIEKAVKGMLPHTKLGRKQYRNLFVYIGEEHKHQAQAPKKLEVK